MSTRLLPGVLLRAIPAGMVEGTKFARVTVTLRPDRPEARTLRDWPGLVDRLLLPGTGGAELALHLVPLAGGVLGERPTVAPGSAVACPLAAPRPDAATARRILDLWRRAMAPGAGEKEDLQAEWGPFQRILSPDVAAASPRQTMVVPTPDAEAALAFTLERGRLVLDALAGPDSPLLERPAARDPSWRPPPSAVLLAARGDVATDALVAAPDPLERHAAATREVAAGRTPEPVWPSPERFARGALGDGETLDALVRDIQTLHLAATPEPERDQSPLGPLEDTAARRRIGTLLSSPVLQRLFGWAVDVHVPLDRLRSLGEPLFLLVAPAEEDATWTLARFAKPHFVPADREELVASGRPEYWAGFRDLGIRSALSADAPRYAICTIDSAATTEASFLQDRRLAEPQPPSPSAGTRPYLRAAPPTATLRNGGLRLIDRDTLCSVAKANVTLPAKPGWLATAADLRTGDRLIIGLWTDGDGTVGWRSPHGRIVHYADPRAAERFRELGYRSAAEAEHWVETALSALVGPPEGARRMELDAGALQNPVQFQMLDAEGKPIVDEPGAAEATVEQLRIISSSTVAAWGGEPMSVPAAEGGRRVGREIVWARHTFDDLDVTRRFGPVTTAGAYQSPLQRFSWPYHLAVASVFDGGYAPGFDALAAAAAAAARPDIVSPAATAPGHRFLRHERIDAPMVLLPEAYWRRVEPDPAQHGADMVVRSPGWAGAAFEGPARRVLAAPPVALHFAAAHDVLRGVTTARPPTGMAGAVVLRSIDTLDRKAVPARLRVGQLRPGEPAPEPYYPDPAASILAIGLFARDGEQPGAPVGEPLLIPVAQRWPATRPVHLELKPGPRGAPLTLRHLGTRSLAAGEALGAANPGALAVEAVEIVLELGADLFAQAWFVPTAEHLASWFDALQAANALATFAENGLGKAPAAAAASGLDVLGCVKAGLVPPGSAGLHCGTLPTAPAGTTRLMAELLHAKMRQAPFTVLASAAVFRVTHAAPEAIAPEFDDGGPLVTRRLIAAGDAEANAAKLAALFTAIPAEHWGEATIEPGAALPLFGGAVVLDRATTGALEVMVTCANPGSEALDLVPAGTRTDVTQAPVRTPKEAQARYGFKLDQDGYPVFYAKTVVVLRLDGLPAPPGGRPERWAVRLEELQAASWGTEHPLGAALRASFPEAIAAQGARWMTVELAALNRNQHLLLRPATPDGKEPAPARSLGRAHRLWLPATLRPTPPEIDRVHLVQEIERVPATRAGGVSSVGARRLARLRVFLRRPWFSSGEAERLGVVIWPPEIAASGTPAAGSPSPAEILLRDADLGPGGAFVSRLGGDPVEASGEVPVADSLLQSTQIAAASGRKAIKVPRAWMPVPSGDPGIDADQVGNPPRMTAVSLMTFEPRFDLVEGLWFVDLALTVAEARPRVRLGLVRYQPHGREDETATEAAEPVRLRVSQPVVQWMRPLPDRRTDVSWSTGDAGTVVVVVVSGPSAATVGDASHRTVVELVRFREGAGGAPGVEEPVMGGDRKPLICRDWNTASSQLGRKNGVATWTCHFTVLGKWDADGWSHAVLVKEYSEFGAADPADGVSVESGASYYARLPLTLE